MEFQENVFSDIQISNVHCDQLAQAAHLQLEQLNRSTCHCNASLLGALQQPFLLAAARTDAHRTWRSLSGMLKRQAQVAVVRQA